jgi:hypothetical protein
VAFIYTLVITQNRPAAFAAAGASFMETLLAGPQGYKPKFGTPPTFPVGGISLSEIFQGTILSIFFPGSKDILRWVQGFAGGSLGAALAAMQKPNPNCILNAVQNQKGLARPFGNVGPTGIIGHDGIHVVALAGSIVKTLPGLTGTVIDVHDGGDGTAIVDVLLDGGGVALYKDLDPKSVAKFRGKKRNSVRLKAGDIIGKTSGGGENMGLHFALLRGGMKEHDYYRDITSGRTKNPMMVGMFIDPNGPDSPVRCPGEPVNNASVNPYKP